MFKKKTARPRGRPPTVSTVIEKKKLAWADSNIEQVLRSHVRGGKREGGRYNNGGYIPVSSKYGGHDVFVVILKDKVPRD